MDFLKIKRSFSILNGRRLFNDRHIANVKNKSVIEIDEPQEEFSIKFASSKFDRSHKYRINPNECNRLEIAINPILRIYLFLFVVSQIALFLWSDGDFSIYLFPMVFLSVFLFFVVFACKTIVVKAFDKDNSKISIEKIKEVNDSNDNL